MTRETGARRDACVLLPLRQLVSAEGDAAHAFARQELLDRLARPDRYRIVGHGGGGEILAASERALAEARAVLRQVYGAWVAFGIPTVHTYVDTLAGTLMVPIIFVRIDAPRAHAKTLQDMLEERQAVVQDVELQRERVLLRAELELCRAVDLDMRIADVTDGAAQVLSWLVRYQRLSEADGRNAEARA